MRLSVLIYTHIDNFLYYYVYLCIQVSPIVSEPLPTTAVIPSGASPSGNAAPAGTNTGASSTSVDFGELYTSARKIFIRNRKAMVVTANGNAPSLESTFTALSSGLGTYLHLFRHFFIYCFFLCLYF